MASKSFTSKLWIRANYHRLKDLKFQRLWRSRVYRSLLSEWETQAPSYRPRANCNLTLLWYEALRPFWLRKRNYSSRRVLHNSLFQLLNWLRLLLAQVLRISKSPKALPSNNCSGTVLSKKLLTKSKYSETHWHFSNELPVRFLLKMHIIRTVISSSLALAIILT